MTIERLPQPGNEDWERYSADHLSRYHYILDRVHGRRVLDCGTGIGYGAAILKIAGAAVMDAVDCEHSTIEAAKRQFGALGVDYYVCDCETLDGHNDAYDVVCSFENIEHLHHPARFLEGAARVMTENGVLFCSTPDRAATKPFVNDKPVNPYHIHEWYRDEFQLLLSEYFDDVELLVQVKSYSLVRRQQAAQLLQGAIDTFGKPRRARQKLERLFLGAKDNIDAWFFGGVLDLASPSQADFPIVDARISPLYGQPFCHFAICRAPKK